MLESLHPHSRKVEPQSQKLCGKDYGSLWYDTESTDDFKLECDVKTPWVKTQGFFFFIFLCWRRHAYKYD